MVSLLPEELVMKTKQTLHCHPNEEQQNHPKNQRSSINLSLQQVQDVLTILVGQVPMDKMTRGYRDLHAPRMNRTIGCAWGGFWGWPFGFRLIAERKSGKLLNWIIAVNGGWQLSSGGILTSVGTQSSFNSSESLRAQSDKVLSFFFFFFLRKQSPVGFGALIPCEKWEIEFLECAREFYHSTEW